MSPDPLRLSGSSRELRADFLSESDYSAWRCFVDQSPSGSIYSYPEYLDALCRVGGGSFRILAILKGEEILGGVGLYERRSMGGRILSNRLLLYYNGIVLREYTSKYPSENTSRTLAILTALEEAISGLGFDFALLQTRHPVTDLRPFVAKGWRARPNFSFVMGLEDLDGTFKRIEQNQRRLIRRCEEEGVSFCTDDDFDAFYEMHRGTHERKGSPIYLPKVDFRRYFDLLASQGLCRLYHARLDGGRAVASQLVLLGGHPTTHTVSTGADPEFAKLGTNPFLRWKACEALTSEGYLGNDLTDAALNKVSRFKSQLGPDLVVNSILTASETIRFRSWLALSGAAYRARRILGGAYRRVTRQKRA